MTKESIQETTTPKTKSPKAVKTVKQQAVKPVDNKVLLDKIANLEKLIKQKPAKAPKAAKPVLSKEELADKQAKARKAMRQQKEKQLKKQRDNDPELLSLIHELASMKSIKVSLNIPVMNLFTRKKQEIIKYTDFDLGNDDMKIESLKERFISLKKKYESTCSYSTPFRCLIQQRVKALQKKNGTTNP